MNSCKLKKLHVYLFLFSNDSLPITLTTSADETAAIFELEKAFPAYKSTIKTASKVEKSDAFCAVQS